jgi:hypothetical protein
MPNTISLTLQDVGGDPFVSGGNINITTASTPGVIFNEVGESLLSTVANGDTLTIDGVTYTYEYLGSHDVRSDPLQPAAYIRITGGGSGSSPDLTIGTTFAIDLTGEPGDPDYPNLQNGNTKGTVTSLDDTTPLRFPGVICFAHGTRIKTPAGWQPVQNLKSGDLVETIDHGPQPIWFMNQSTHKWSSAPHNDKPICIPSCTLGSNLPENDLYVSPQHRVLLRNSKSGEEVLAAAKSLTEIPGVRQMNGKRTAVYFHVILKQHAILNAEGVQAESFYPGELALETLPILQRAALENLMSASSEGDGSNAYAPARPFVGVQHAREMLCEEYVVVGAQGVEYKPSDPLPQKFA